MFGVYFFYLIIFGEIKLGLSFFGISKFARTLQRKKNKNNSYVYNYINQFY
jgi:hypothetical protein